MKDSLSFTLWCFSALLLCMALPVRAASFDCARAATPLEKALCANPRLGVLDEELAVAYRRLLGSVGSPLDELVKKSQREWLRSRSAEFGELRGKELDEVLRTSLQHRIEALNGALVTQDGVRVLTVDRAVVQKVAPDMADYARGQQQVTQTSSPLYVLDEAPGAKGFNALIDRLFARATDPDSLADGEYTMAAELNFASRGLLSVSVGSSAFGFGAAHPVGRTRQLNFLLAEGREMKAHDLFRGRAYESIILEPAARAFADAGLKPLASAREARALLLDPQNWALDARGLTVVVPPDSLFAHVDGSPEVPTILWKEFHGQLTPLGEHFFGR